MLMLLMALMGFSVCSPGCPGNISVYQAGLEVTEIWPPLLLLPEMRGVCQLLHHTFNWACTTEKLVYIKVNAGRYVCAHCTCLVPAKAGREHWIPWTWTCR